MRVCVLEVIGTVSNVAIAGTDYRLERESVTGCCKSLRDFEEPEMQSCISGSVLLVRIAH